MLASLVDSTGGGRAEESSLSSCAACAHLTATVADLTRRLEHLESGQAVIIATLPAEGLPLPVEPAFPLEEAASLVPMTATALKGFLQYHPVGRAFPRRYRHFRNQRYRRIRFLLASEICAIRQVYLRESARAA
jgi:hypothetical protein